MVARERVTIREVARLAGVHPATVSRALNAETEALVNVETVKRVRQAAEQLDYEPNHSARSLKTRRSHTIGVIVPDLTNPLFPPIVRGIEDRLAAAGYVALIGNTDNDPQRESLVFRRMQSRYVDGFILATARLGAAMPVAAESVAEPTVLVNRVSDGEPISSVAVDDMAGSRLAVRHLVDLGHTRIAYLAGPLSLSTGKGRRDGFMTGMREAGVEPDADLVHVAEYFSEEEGYRCGRLMLERGGFTAVLTGNDTLALGVMRAVAALGCDCPADVSVVGFNDMAFVDRVQPALTTVRVPKYELGWEAAQLMLERLNQTSGAVKSVLLAPELVVRASTAPPPAHAVRPAASG